MAALFDRAVWAIVVMTLMGACAHAASEDSSTTASSAPGSTTTTGPATPTSPPSPSITTSTTPPEMDLVNPVAGTLAGVSVGSAAGTVLETLDAAYGPADEDSGWIADECLGRPRVRYVGWGQLNVYLSEDDVGTVWLDGYTLGDHPDADAGLRSDEIELPGGITLGMSHAGAASLYPDGAYAHESLDLDGVVLEAPHFLAVIGQASEDRSGPLTQVWVGSIPVCG